MIKTYSSQISYGYLLIWRIVIFRSALQLVFIFIRKAKFLFVNLAEKGDRANGKLMVFCEKRAGITIVESCYASLLELIGLCSPRMMIEMYFGK